MQLVQLFAIISTILAIYTTIPYVIAVLKKKTIPHQLTWLVFFIMNCIVFLSQYLAGARESVLISLIYVIGSFIILLLSMKYGTRNSSKFDQFLFLFSIFTIILWMFTKNNSLAIWLTVVIDISATSMMVLKIKKQPNSEDPFPWIMSGFAYVFTCLTLVGTPVSILYVRPIYGLLFNIVLVTFIYYFKNKSTKKTLYQHK